MKKPLGDTPPEGVGESLDSVPRNGCDAGREASVAGGVALVWGILSWPVTFLSAFTVSTSYGPAIHAHPWATTLGTVGLFAPAAGSLCLGITARRWGRKASQRWTVAAGALAIVSSVALGLVLLGVWFADRMHG